MSRQHLVWITLVAVQLVTRPAVAARLSAYVTNFDGDSVSVIDVATQRVTATIPVGSGPIGVAATPDGRLVYVANFLSNSVSVLRATTNTLADTIAIDGAPNRVAVTPDGASVYVTNTSPGTVSVIDRAARNVTATIPAGIEPAGIAIAPDGRLAYVADFGIDAVVVVDTTLRAVVSLIPLPPFGSLSHHLIDVAFCPDGRFASAVTYSTSALFLIDPATGSASEVLGVPDGPEALACSPDSSMVYVVSSGEPLTTKAYIPSFESFRITVGNHPEALAVTPDGGMVYVANTGADTVSVVAAVVERVVATVSVGHSPMGVAFAQVPPACVGDCDDDGHVTVDELIAGARVVVGKEPVDVCAAFDRNGDRTISVDELLQGVSYALAGCPE